MDQHLNAISEIARIDISTATVDEPDYARYLKWLGSILLAGGLLVMLFVAVLDPYHQFQFVDSQGFNRIKPLPGHYREQIKLAQAKAVQPTALLLGNSRIEVGFDPASPHLKKLGHSAYNLALAGTPLTITENTFIQLRKERAPLSLAIVGVEFLDFLGSTTILPPPPNESAGLASSYWRFDTLFSIKSLSDAWLTLQLQDALDPETMTTRGHTPLFEYNRYARREGYHAIFQQRGQENAKTLWQKQRSLRGLNAQSPNAKSLRRMLAMMAQDGTEAHFIIYPYHAELMAMFSAYGLLPAMEEWKSLLVREVDLARTQYPHAQITLWDFSGYGEVQCQPIPRPGDTRSVTPFYWEAGHFKPSVGELIFSRIAGKDSAFGQKLTAASLEQNQRRIAAELEQCSRTNPEIFSAARSMVAAVPKT